MTLNSHLWIDNPSVQSFSETEFNSFAAGFIGHNDPRPYWELFSQGFTIIKNAVDHDVIDNYIQSLSLLLQSPSCEMLASCGREPKPISEMDPSVPLTKVLDVHWALAETALPVCLADPLLEFISTIFQDAVMPFQSLHFEVGSTQAVHQDAAYVVIDKFPNHFLASWVALEDIKPGSGELVYYPGSHKYENFLYGEDKDRKHWDPSIDGHQIHDHHLYWLHEQAKKSGLSMHKFNPSKGDALIWHSDLAHGGGEIIDKTLTRRSLVTHYTRRKDTPFYLRNCTSDQRRAKIRDVSNYAAISSMYYV